MSISMYTQYVHHSKHCHLVNVRQARKDDENIGPEMIQNFGMGIGLSSVVDFTLLH